MSGEIRKSDTRISLADRVALSPKEVAKTIGCSDSTVRRYMKEEGLPYSRVLGRVYILMPDLVGWLESHKEDPRLELNHLLAIVDRGLNEVKSV